MEKKHRRIPMAEIRETPSRGYYIPRKNAQTYALWAAFSVLFFYWIGFFRGKRRQ